MGKTPSTVSDSIMIREWIYFITILYFQLVYFDYFRGLKLNLSPPSLKSLYLVPIITFKKIIKSAVYLRMFSNIFGLPKFFLYWLRPCTIFAGIKFFAKNIFVDSMQILNISIHPACIHCSKICVLFHLH